MGPWSALRAVLTPRYVPLLLADAAYLVLLAFTSETVTLEPGQGALKRVYVFPLYRGTYRTSDVVMSAPATDPWALLLNALLGLVVLYVPITLLVNLVGPDSIAHWRPRNAYPLTWVLWGIALLVGFFYATLAGHGGLTVWYLALVTTLVTIWLGLGDISGEGAAETGAPD